MVLSSFRTKVSLLVELNICYFCYAASLLNTRKVLGSVFLSCIDIKVIKVCSFYFLTQLLRNKLVSTARKSIKQNANLGQLYRSMQEAYHEMQTPLVYQTPSGLVRIYCDPSEM